MKSKKRLGNSANFVSFRDLATPSFLGNRERWNEQIPIVISKLKMDEERRIFSGSLCKKFGSDRLVPFFLIFISCFFSVVCFGSCLSSRDGIRVYDGPDVRSPVMAHLCDSSNHVPFWSSSSQLLVEFFSDSAGQRTFEGFEAKFHFVSTAGASASSSASSSTAGQGWPLISLASSFCYHMIRIMSIFFGENGPSGRVWDGESTFKVNVKVSAGKTKQVARFEYWDRTGCKWAVERAPKFEVNIKSSRSRTC